MTIPTVCICGKKDSLYFLLPPRFSLMYSMCLIEAKFHSTFTMIILLDFFLFFLRLFDFFFPLYRINLIEGCKYFFLTIDIELKIEIICTCRCCIQKRYRPTISIAYFPKNQIKISRFTLSQFDSRKYERLRDWEPKVSVT